MVFSAVRTTLNNLLSIEILVITRHAYEMLSPKSALI